MRKSWTDERLDDFAAHTDQRFDAVDLRFDAVDRRFDRVDKDLREFRAEVDAKFDRLHTRFDAFQRAMLQIGGGVIVALIGIIATQL